MNKSDLEMAFRLRPIAFKESDKVDEEIKRIEAKIREMEEAGRPVDECLKMALDTSYAELKKIYQLITLHSKAKWQMDYTEEKIMEYRFSNGFSEPAKWKDVAEKLGLNRSTVERKYKKIVDRLTLEVE